jgi:hypothetical protein
MRTALVALMLLVACTPVAVAPPSPSTTPAATASPTPPTPTPTRSPRVLRSPEPLPAASLVAVVLSYERSTDLPSAGGPELLVTSDGQVISAPNFGRQLMARRLAPAGVVALRNAALETGLFDGLHTIGRKVLPGASPNLNRGFESLSIAVRADGRDVRVGTFARDHEDDLYEWDPGREEFLALAARLADLSWLPASAWLDSTPRPYAATFHRLYIETMRNVAPPGVTVLIDDLWPFTTSPDSLGEPVAVDTTNAPTLAARCVVVTADDARSFAAEVIARMDPHYQPNIRGVGGTFRWLAGNGEILVQLEPLLPHVAPTCAGVRRLVF